MTDSTGMDGTDDTRDADDVRGTEVARRDGVTARQGRGRPPGAGDPGGGDRIRRRRLVALAVVALSATGVGAIDRVTADGSSTTLDVAIDLEQLPVSFEATPSGSAGSVWFCPVLGNGVSTAGDVITLANSGDAEASGTVEVIASTGERRTAPVVVAGGATVIVPIGPMLDVQRAAAVVELDRGGITAEVTLDSEHGPATAACSSVAGRAWYLADGRTTRDALTELALFNPFPEAALIDLQFATDRGAARPAPLQGINVPAGSVRIVDVGQYVRRRELVAASVVVRSGRLVVGERQVRTGLLGVQGAAVTVAVPAPGRTWFIPQLLTADGLRERVTVLNPGSADVTVEVTILTADDVSEPVEVAIGAGRVEPIDLVALGAPDGEPFALAVAVVGEGDGVVVQRTTEAVDPARRRGIATMPAVPRAATRWVIPTVGATGRRDTRIIAFNPFDVPAPLVFRFLTTATEGDGASVPELDPVEVQPGTAVEIRLGDTVSMVSGALEVVSQGPPIVVQRDLITGTGDDTVVAAPTTTTTIAPPAPTTTGAAASTTTSRGTTSTTPTTSVVTSTPPPLPAPTASAVPGSTVPTTTVLTTTVPTTTVPTTTVPTTTAASSTTVPTTTVPTTAVPSASGPSIAPPLVPRFATPGRGLTSGPAVIVP